METRHDKARKGNDMDNQKLAQSVRRAIARDDAVRRELLEVAHNMARRKGNEGLLADLRNAIDPRHRQRIGPMIAAEIAAAVGIALIADGE